MSVPVVTHVLVTSLGEESAGRAFATALGVVLAGEERRAACAVCLPGERDPRPTLLSSRPARELERALRAAGCAAAARGAICEVRLDDDSERALDLMGSLAALAPDPAQDGDPTPAPPPERTASPATSWSAPNDLNARSAPPRAPERTASAARPWFPATGEAALAPPPVVFLPPAQWRQALDADAGRGAAAVICCERGRHRALAALLAIELRRHEIPAQVVFERPGVVGTRRAAAGLEPGGPLGRRARRAAVRLGLGAGPAAESSLLSSGGPASPRRPATPASARSSASPASERGQATSASERSPATPASARSPATPASECGQAMPLLLFVACAVVLGALALTLLAAASTGGGRVQRAVDLAAVSAARSLRDDHPRRFVPPTLPDGAPNPRHLSRADYLERAVAAARQALARNGLGKSRVAVTFPGGGPAPTRVRVEVSARGHLPAGVRPGRGMVVDAGAAAEAFPVASAPAGTATATTHANATSATASGGGYSGPLELRDGEGMRPDVAGAYDRMRAAAGRAGHALYVNSGFRSDAEQARLFAANPDPRWVAPPGRSLHRCATELDLGPPSAYAWLAANAPRFGFERRYTWEPWHFGFTDGPEPCSAAGAGGDGRGRSNRAAPGDLPAFVPARYRKPLARAAGRWNVSAPLLAAQLMAESGFNPSAVSPAGARGIAQFMPATAAAYGLRDPFDPVASINAQARLMSELLARFGSPELALAAYNAGPAPVAACGCVPPYAETRAYVLRIMGLLGGAGLAPPPVLEVRLVG